MCQGDCNWAVGSRLCSLENWPSQFCRIHAKKLPLDSTLLKTFSLLNPVAFGQTNTAILLKPLPTFLPTISAKNFKHEIMCLQSDINILPTHQVPIDVWWNKGVLFAQIPRCY